MGGDKAQTGSAPESASQRDRMRFDRRGWASTIALLATTIAVALWAMPTAIQAGDAGEFATVMLTGGVPHPSGYPWMRALGLPARALWSMGVTPAKAAAIPPALAGAAAWAVLHRGCVRLIPEAARGWWVGLGAALALAVIASAPVVVLHTNDSEVWGPHLLFSALFMHAVIRARDEPRPLALGAWLGLAVSHHSTAILLVPLAIGAAWPRSLSNDLGANAVAVLRNGLLGLLGSVIGLLPWLSLPIGAGGGWRWGDVRSVDGLVHHLLRRDYGTFSLSLHEEQVAATDTVGRCLSSLGEVFSAGLSGAGWFGALVVFVAIAGAAAWVVVRERSETGPATSVVLGWIGTVVVATVGFASVHNIDPDSPFGAWILERFDLLPTLVLALGLAIAIELGNTRLARAPERTAKIVRGGAIALAAACLFAQLGAVLERGTPASERGVEVAALDLLATPDPEAAAVSSAQGEPVRAIVFGTDDHRTFPVLYASEVLDGDRHTLYIDAQLLAHDWYRARLRARVPALPDIDKPLRMIGAIWSDPTIDGVAIYLANVFSAPASRLERVPEGMLWRVPPPADHPRFVADDWRPSAIADRHLAALGRCRGDPAAFAGDEHPRGHPWSADLLGAYVEPSRAIARMLVATDQRARVPELDAALRRCVGIGLDGE